MANAMIFFILFAYPCSGARIQQKNAANVANVPLNSLADLLAVSEPASAFQAGAAMAPGSRAAAPRMNAELEELGQNQLPGLGVWDPLGLAKQNFWNQGNEATVGFLRHAEIKHGRVAMAAFVGYLLQSNSIYFPWKLTDEISFEDISAVGSPPEQWDALPTVSKAQILVFIGFLETWSETSNVLANDGNAHYMRGGVPGKFPRFSANTQEAKFPSLKEAWLPHPVPFNLYDPFNLNAGRSREDLDRSLIAEINNGRLAMLGIMAFLAEQKVPGAVPVLKGLVTEYAGEPMAAFSESDSSWAFVDLMLKNSPSFPVR